MVLSRRLNLFALLVLCCVTIASASARASDLTDALKARDVAQVRSLLAAGADANEVVRGEYPLNIAAAFGPAEMVTILLDAGADIGKPDRNGLHPLHNAVLAGHKEIVALLIESGAVVDAKDKESRTPLHRFAASAGSDIEIARILLAAGADPNIKSAKQDESPSALLNAVESANLKLVELLIASRADVNHRTALHWSPLHQAVYNNRPEIVRLLIAHGADISQATSIGKTPLSLASNDAMRKLLIEAGAK